MHDFLEIFLSSTYIASNNIYVRLCYYGGAIDRGKPLILIAASYTNLVDPGFYVR